MTARPTLRDLEGAAPFETRHLGPSVHDQAKMLAAIGYRSLDDLVAAAVPAGIRSPESIQLPPGMGPLTQTSFPDYFTVSNWAFSPPLRKFVDTLPGLTSAGANLLGNYIPVAVADIDLAKDGTSDPELFDGLMTNSRMTKLLSYAGWNTAGNTMGTSIPCANVYLLSRRIQRDALKRELSLREFLLHRFVNDYQYHKFTRPQAYKMIDSFPRASREETYGEEFSAVNDFVREDVERRLQETFSSQFMGKRFYVGARQYEIDGMNSIKVFLPWPRAYEVRIEFRISAKPVDN